jgi:uncharacterized membrane protein (UPF0127 family)
MLARMHIAILVAVSLAASGAACRNGRSATAPAPSPMPGASTGTPTVVLHATAGGQRSIPVRVELALTGPQRERGLMFRNHLEPDTGMLFLFPSPAPLTFWMKNTLIPLDMIFIDSNRRILGIVENAEPETETGRHVEGNSQYVLEIGGGLSQKWGVAAGSTVDFQGLPATAIPN